MVNTSAPYLFTLLHLLVYCNICIANNAADNATLSFTTFFPKQPIHIKLFKEEKEGGVGTVGAVAVDSHGHVAVATSTGGMSGKAVGRIGDTPQIGSGTYADDNIGGVSTTGHGESILKYCLAHSIVKLIEGGQSADVATRNAVTGMTSRLNNTAGAITLSKDGDVGVHFSSKRMAWAYVKNNQVYYGIEQNQVLEEPYKGSTI